MHVTIIGRPAGEAPEWVRDAWIGLRLPLGDPHKRNWRGTGVLTGATGFSSQLWALIRGRTVLTRGYLVQAKESVETLERANPAAAAWWRENAPHLLTGVGGFVFEEEVCRPDDA
jgi:hypothetical protein